MNMWPTVLMLLFVSFPFKSTFQSQPIDEMLNLAVLVESINVTTESEDTVQVENMIKTMPDRLKLDEHSVKMTVIVVEAGNWHDVKKIIDGEMEIRSFSMAATNDGAVKMTDGVQEAKKALNQKSSYAIKAMLVVTSGQVPDVDGIQDMRNITWLVQVGTNGSEWGISVDRIFHINDTDRLWTKFGEFAHAQRCQPFDVCCFNKEIQCKKTKWYPRAYKRPPCPNPLPIGDDCPSDKECHERCDAAATEWKPTSLDCVKGAKNMTRIVTKAGVEEPLLDNCPMTIQSACPTDPQVRSGSEKNDKGSLPGFGLPLIIFFAVFVLAITIIAVVIVVVRRRRRKKRKDPKKKKKYPALSPPPSPGSTLSSEETESAVKELEELRRKSEENKSKLAAAKKSVEKLKKSTGASLAKGSGATKKKSAAVVKKKKGGKKMMKKVKG